MASGTGEHAALLASAVRGLTIQPVEPDAAMHGSIAAWAEDVAAAMAAPAVDAPSSSTAANTAANIATATSAVLPALGTDVRKLTTGALVSGFSPAHCILWYVLSRCVSPSSTPLTPPFAHQHLHLHQHLHTHAQHFPLFPPLRRACSVNMIHISPWECTEALFWSTGDVLAPGGLLWTYGPYKEGGTDGLGMCDSNVTFDESLRARDPEWGVRSVGAVEAAANAKGTCMRACIRISVCTRNNPIILTNTSYIGSISCR